jgi:hypothetical protein
MAANGSKQSIASELQNYLKEAHLHFAHMQHAK